MRLLFLVLYFVLSAILLSHLILPLIVHLEAKSFITSPQPLLGRAVENTNLILIDPDGDPNPVVNEGKQMKLRVVALSGLPITDVTFTSDSPDVAAIDSATGILTGIQQGFTTITARRSNGEKVSNFIVVVRVSPGKGKIILGDTKVNIAGEIYLSDPIRNII